jgi:hypothetical protein
VVSYELSPSLCEELLRAGVFGRLGVSAPDGPHVIPLNYAVIDDAVVVRTTPHGVAGRRGPGTVAAFEIDYVEYDGQRGWSVQARGPLEAVPEAELAHVAPAWVPRPWADGARPLFLRLRWTELTGRRIGAGWDPLRRLPVRRVV